MATEKTLNTRIALKIDTLERWNQSTIGLKKGELALATTAASAGTGLSEPVIMIKVGEDGVKTFKDLQWNVYAKASDVLAACKTEAGLKAFINGVIADAGIATNEAMEALAGRVTTAEGEIDTLQSEMDAVEAKAEANETAIGVLNGNAETAGSVAKAIKDAIDALDLANTYEAKGEAKKVQDNLDGLNDTVEGILDGESINTFHGVEEAIQAVEESIESTLTTTYATKTEAQGYANAKDTAIAAAQKAGDDAMAEAQKKVASVAAADNSMTVAGTATAPTVAVKLDPAADNAIKLSENGLKVEIGAAPEYTIVKAENSGDYAAVYNLTKDGTVVGDSINIPKDMVVESGSVVENPDGQPAGTYIKLVLQNVEEPLYINVGNLIEYVTSGSQTGDMVVVTVDDNHKVTATITDGTITLDKLTTEVQTKINQAHTHENAAVLNGIDADDVAAWNAAEQNAKDYADGLDEAMNTRVEAAEAAIEALNSENGKVAAATKADSATTAENIGTIAAADVATKTDVSTAKSDAITAAANDAAGKYETTGNATAKLNEAKGHADSLNTAMNARVEALEAIDHDHTNKTELDKFVDGDKAKLDAAIQSVTSVAGNGIKATTTGTAVTIDWDTDVTLVFDCGDSGVTTA